VTLTEAFDRFELVIGDDAPVGDDRAEPVLAAELVEGFIGDIAADGVPADDERPEPVLAAAPFFIEFDEPDLLDPERTGLIWELQPASLRTIEMRSPLASLGFHLLPLLGLIIWPLMMIEPPMQIPVQLVFEQQPSPPAQPQQQPKPPQMEVPPRGPLSSVDQGAVNQADLGRSSDPLTPPAAGQAQPAAAVAPPVPQPKPTPPKEDQAAVHPPKPSGAPVAHHDDTPHEAPHSARYAGSAASRDDYLAYLVTLTRQHIDLLPMSMVGDRHGETVISVLVYDNGRLGPISVMRGSGYPDIDDRIEKMVAAVGHFPPLPQWYQGNAVQLELTLKFPEALEQTH
jgi:outer membrane biosynthesis protein TonB